MIISNSIKWCKCIKLYVKN